MFAKFRRMVLKKVLYIAGRRHGTGATAPGGDFALIDKTAWNVQLSPDRHFQLYRDSLVATGTEAHDNFLKQLRFYGLFQLAEWAAETLPEGDFAECGCWKGQSTWAIARLIADSGRRRSFHVFDSFEGLSEFTAEDRNPAWPIGAERQAKLKRHFRTSEDAVRTKLAEFDFVAIYRGWIPERFGEIAGRRFAFVHLDVDMHRPTVEGLDFFWPRLVEGGILVCDDYGSRNYPGATRAFEACVAAVRPRFWFRISGGGAFAIK